MKFTRWMICLVSIVALAGCSSGSDASPPSGSASGLAVAPQSITFSTQPGQQTTVDISGGTPPYTVRAQDPRLVALGSPQTGGSGVAFTVTPVASGTTTINVTDSGAQSAAVAVTTPICTPPGPELFLSYPAPSSPGVAATTTEVWVAEPNSDPTSANIGGFALRLVGSDGSAIQGSNFESASSPPPTGSAQPPAGPTYSYRTSAVSGLHAGLTYQVQITNVTYPCMPPTLLGQFST